MNNQVLFIGSFKLPVTGYYGGVYFASTSLRDKMEQEDIKVIELDTTLKDISVTEVYKRLPTIIARGFYFLYKIMFSPKANSLFIFVSAGNSYIDKLPSILLARMLRKKVVVFPRSGHFNNDFNKKFYRFFIKKALKYSNTIICQSSYWYDYFVTKGLDEDKLRVIENWVPNKTLKISVGLSYPNYNINSDETFRMVFVSRIEEAKGITDILNVVKILPKELNYQIDIYGEGSYKDEFLESTKSNGFDDIIKYKGWLDKNEMQKTLNSYHLALFASRVEGYPNSLLDFIFSKIPIIAYAIPSVKAVGNDKVLYYNDVNDMADKIMYSYHNYQEVLLLAKKLYEVKVIRNNIDYTFSQIPLK